MANLKKLLILVQVGLAYSVQTQATEISDSIYANQTVSTTISVNTSENLQSQSVTVTPEGRLTLTSLHKVTLNGNVQVQAGGVLVIRTGQPPRIIYTYDASGNRTRREKEQ